ncbi:Uma2 family endonuclease [Jiangella alba]|uniref:Endonuclease, Uma2 family (Restriction endonuclease fold) n=1 Tax=Jiangella alba TaxID=561176 RepID=A0A1H5LP87_9ACTN|nr:Uma2 family endonuclease [Jiangella alba]SEE78810.1 Endonuclease, Uma2 family (restriction endonuclease fold) [Jiangella alba]
MKTLELPDVVEWTPEVLERLSPEFRYEVREGNLVVMAAAMRPWHADVQSRVRNLLVDRGGPTYIEQGVILPDGEIRTCDVGVFARPPSGKSAYHPAADFALLVEVVSDGSRREDREVKPRLYAAAGVPEYWRIEEDTDGEAVVYQYRLARLTDGPATYVETRVTTLTTLES